MKKLTIFLLMVGVLCGATPVMAEHDKGHGASCSTEGKCSKCEDKGGDCDSAQCPIVAKTLKKAHFYLENADELGLSDEQTAKIRSIKMAAKKDAIRMDAEMQISQMDFETKLREDKVDVEGINAMMDQAMAGWAAQGKAAIQRYADLRGVLSAEQNVKAKAIWKKK